MKGWKLGALLIGIGVVGLVVGAAISRADGWRPAGPGVMDRGSGRGAELDLRGAYAAQRQWTEERGWFGACGQLLRDPEARQAMLELRTEHAKEMQAWFDKYGENPRSAEARSALEKLREEHRNDMRELLDKSGIDPDTLPGRGGMGPGMMLGPGTYGDGDSPCGGSGCWGGQSGAGTGTTTQPGAGSDGVAWQ